MFQHERLNSVALNSTKTLSRYNKTVEGVSNTVVGYNKTVAGAIKP